MWPSLLAANYRCQEKDSLWQKCSTIPKDTFPSLLKRLREKLKPTEAENIKSGFRQCGIILFSMYGFTSAWTITYLCVQTYWRPCHTCHICMVFLLCGLSCVCVSRLTKWLRNSQWCSRFVSRNQSARSQRSASSSVWLSIISTTGTAIWQWPVAASSASQQL